MNVRSHCVPGGWNVEEWGKIKRQAMDDEEAKNERKRKSRCKARSPQHLLWTGGHSLERAEERI